MSKFLVLGASGFIGKNLVTRLCVEHDVVAYDMRIEQSFENLNRVTSVVGSFSTETRWDKLLEGIDAVYHMISTTVPMDKTNHIYEEICENVLPTVLLLEAMKDCGVSSLIFISSGGTVYGRHSNYAIPEEDQMHPICSYGVQKQVIENYINFYNSKYNMNCLIARVSNPYGKGHNLQRQQGIIPIFLCRVINHDSITVFGDGSIVRDYIYMDDLVDALFKLSTYSGDQKVFNIGNGRGYSINQVLQTIITVTEEKEVDILYVSGRDCDVKCNILDISKATKELKWTPNYNLEEGIKKLYQIYKS